MKNVEKKGKNHQKCRKIIKNVEKLLKLSKNHQICSKTGTKPTKMPEYHQKY